MLLRSYPHRRASVLALMVNDQNLACRFVLPETRRKSSKSNDRAKEKDTSFAYQKKKQNTHTHTHHEAVSTNNASHSFSLLTASRMGGAHLKRVSPSGISSAEKAK